MTVARKPYIITDKSTFLCVTCRTRIKTRRMIDAHECPPLCEVCNMPQSSNVNSPLCAVDYDKLNRIVRKQRAALTCAIKSGDRERIVAVCRAAVAEWNAPGMMWPDDWSRWQRALDDAYPVFHAPRLEDL